MDNPSRVLALETTDVTGSVALAERGKIIALKRLDPDQRSARSLAPAIRDVLREAQWRSSDVEIVAATVGPGSFTGLRVGLATAKMFAWSVGAKLVGVDSLDAIVFGLDNNSPNLLAGDCADGTLVSAGVDAQRGDVALRNYWVAGDGQNRKFFDVDGKLRVLPIRKWLDVEKTREEIESEYALDAPSLAFLHAEPDLELASRNFDRRAALFVGPALKRVKNREENYPNVKIADPALWGPSADGVALAAWTRVLRGEFDDPFAIAPIYSRKAAAEERAIEKARMKEAQQNK